MKLEPWSISHLHEAAQRDLACCQTQSERGMCYAVNAREIVRKAKEWARARKLTPGEIAIAETYGYRHEDQSDFASEQFHKAKVRDRAAGF